MSEEKQKELSAKEKLVASKIIESANILSHKMCDLMGDHLKDHVMNDTVAIMAIGDLMIGIGGAEAKAVTRLYAQLGTYSDIFLETALKPLPRDH